MLSCGVIHMTCLSLFAASSHKWDPSWQASHSVRLRRWWKKTEMIKFFLCYLKLKKVTSTKEHLETALAKKLKKNNHLSKRDQKVGYKIAKTLFTYCSLQWCCYQNFSLYSESKDLSCRAQGLLSQRQLGRSQPLCFIHTWLNRMSEPCRIVRFSLETYQTKYPPLANCSNGLT